MNSYFTYKRKFVSKKGSSSNIFDILPERLTINRPIVPPNNTTLARTRETIFKEVKVADYKPDNNDAWIAQQLRKHKLKTLNTANHIYYTLKKIVFSTWKPDKLKIITHSGGYDSRIISDIIANLYLENGSKWLGKVLFVEMRGESKEFKKIMDAQGWEESQQLVIHPKEYEHISFSFDHLRTRFKGFTSYPVNIWTDPLLLLKENGIINGDYQHYTGFGAYYEKAVRNMKYADFLIMNNFYQLASFNFNGQTVMPFFFYDYLIALRQCAYRIPKNMRTSEYICKNNLRYLEHIKRPNIVDMRRRKVNIVSKQTLSNVQRIYDNSEYGQKHPLMFTNKIEYSKQWGMWNIANFVEKLKKQHKIII